MGRPAMLPLKFVMWLLIAGNCSEGIPVECWGNWGCAKAATAAIPVRSKVRSKRVPLQLRLVVPPFGCKRVL